MVILQILILSGFFNVPSLTDFGQFGGVVLKSGIMTLVSITSTAYTLYIESNELLEGFTEYIMYSLNAK